MSGRVAALLLHSLGAALLLPQSAEAQSAMCVEQAFAAALERAEVQAAQAPSPVRDEDLPWCASAEDPRCAPLHGDSTPAGMGLRQPLACDADATDSTAHPTGDDSFTPRTGPAPRAGQSYRVERPPR